MSHFLKDNKNSVLEAYVSKGSSFPILLLKSLQIYPSE